MKIATVLLAAGVIGASFGFPGRLSGQEPAGAGTADSKKERSEQRDKAYQANTKGQKRIVYERPTEKTKLENYFFDGFGPYPIAGAAIIAGINQADNTPPEWGGGAEAFGKRVGSNYGINMISTTTRYALSEVLHQDTLYYRCQCTGFFPRLGHALVSTLTARHGDEGHYIFSVPALVAPYVGTMTATHTWFPERYNAKDAFRMGNYSLLALAAGNVAIEFLYRGPHTFLSRIHLDNRHAAPEPDGQ
ncbi:MAG TPA: hypothetical protein VIM00_09205 [Candidatus Acidoferrum sp.]